MLVLIVLTALGTLSMLTVSSVRGGLKNTANDRFRTIALYAAESGGAAAMDWLRTQYNVGGTRWSALVSAHNDGVADPLAVQLPHPLLGNARLPGEVGNPFTPELGAYYEVELFNNRGDPGYPTGDDHDGRLIIRSTGHGPNGTTTVIEWEVVNAGTTVSRPCSVYAQQGQAEDNAGRNDCLGAIDTGQTATFTP